MSIRTTIVSLFLFLTLPQTTFAKTISEAEFARQFLLHYPGLAALRLDPEIAKEELREAKGDFDPLLSFEGHYLIDKRAQSSTVFGTDNRQLTYQFGVEKKWPMGLTSEFSLRTDRETTNSPFATLSPSFEPTLEMDLRANLLRNSFGFSDRRWLASFSSLADATTLATQWEIETDLAGALAAYWALATAESLLRVSLKTLDTADEFLKAVTVRQQIGTAEDTDLLAARALVLERENDVTAAKRMVSNASDKVLLLIQDHSRKTVSTGQEASFNLLRKLEEELATAIAKRSDLQAAHRELKARSLRVEAYKNSRLPLIDLVTSFQLNGLKGDQAKALSDAFTADHPSFFGGLEIEIPIPDKKAKAFFNTEKFKHLKLLFQAKELEEDISREVSQAYRNVETAKKQVRVFTEIADLNFKKWKEEEKKFSMGRSNSDTVIRFEREWVEASWELIEAKLKGRLYWIELRRVTGDLLDTYQPSPPGRGAK